MAFNHLHSKQYQYISSYMSILNKYMFLPFVYNSNKACTSMSQIYISFVLSCIYVNHYYSHIINMNLHNAYVCTYVCGHILNNYIFRYEVFNLQTCTTQNSKEKNKTNMNSRSNTRTIIHYRRSAAFVRSINRSIDRSIDRSNPTVFI